MHVGPATMDVDPLTHINAHLNHHITTHAGHFRFRRAFEAIQK
jgi:hypothetical protein